MSDDEANEPAAYVAAAAHLTEMPLSAERLRAVTSVMTRIALFAADIAEVELANEVEIAGIFTP